MAVSADPRIPDYPDSWVDCCSCALICIANSCVSSQLAQSQGTSKVRCLERTRRAVAPALINVWLDSNARLRAARLALAQRLQEVQATEYAARWESEYQRVEAKHAEYPQAHGPIGRHLRGVRRSTRRSRASTVQRFGRVLASCSAVLACLSLPHGSHPRACDK